MLATVLAINPTLCSGKQQFSLVGKVSPLDVFPSLTGDVVPILMSRLAFIRPMFLLFGVFFSPLQWIAPSHAVFVVKKKHTQKKPRNKKKQIHNAAKEKVSTDYALI